MLKISRPSFMAPIDYANTGPSANVFQGTIVRPLPKEIFQRREFIPSHAHAHHPGGPLLGWALVPFAADLLSLPDPQLEYRVVALSDSSGREIEWTNPHNIQSIGKRISGRIKVPAGGWYRLEMKYVDRKGNTIAEAKMEPFGVGEVFLIAGQSYACGSNDKLMNVEDPQERVVTLDCVKHEWTVANDPQPNVHGGHGTIWPCMGNSLLPMIRVPIGFANVAVGATSSQQWLPGGELFENLTQQAKYVGRFRAILWQQGESDVIMKTSTAQYVRNLTMMKKSLANTLAFDPPWLLAKSTFHPTVYNNPEGEAQIRAAIDQLCQLPGFYPGPDTDILARENRGGSGTLQHFTGIGQKRAGLLWFSSIWSELNRPNSS